MTKPSKNSNKSRVSTPKGAAADKSTATAEPAGQTQVETVTNTPAGDKKKAAQAEVIARTDTGPGSGKAAAAQGGTIAPADSSLVGAPDAGRAAAAPKPDEAPAAETSRMPKTGSAPRAAAEAGMADPAKAQGGDGGTPLPKPAPVQNVTVHKTGFWPALFGGVIAAGLGAGGMYYWDAQQSPQLDPAQIEAQAVRAAEAAAQQIAEAASQAAGARVDAVEAALSALPAGDEDRQAATMAGLEAMQAQSRQIASLEAAAEAAGQAIAQLQAALDQQASRIEGLSAGGAVSSGGEAQLQALTAQAAALQDQIQETAQQAQAQIAAAQAEAAKLQEAAVDSTKRAQAVAAVAALQAALDRGVTAQEARDALTGAGIDAPEALQQDVPSLAQLQAGFAEASRSALRAALRENSAQGGNVVTNFLRAQTGARSLTPREGDDTDAILSRANAHVEAGDIAGALTETSALPQAAAQAPVMAAWLASAGAYRDAHAALDDLSAATN